MTIPPSFVTIKTVHGVEVVERRVSLADALSLEMQAIHVSSLSFSPIHPTEFYLLLPPLSKRMPFLEELQIVVRQSPSSKSPYLTMPSLELPGSNFLLLETLRLDGVALSMTSPFLTSLRHLVLTNYPDVQPRLLITDFMDALESCPNLEELEIRHYGGIFSTDTEEPRRPANLERLKKLTIQEPSIIISLLLEWLFVPVFADVHVTMDLTCAHMDMTEGCFGNLFHVILPTAQDMLPIRQEIVSIEVNYADNTYQVVGETPLGNKLVIEASFSADPIHHPLVRSIFYESILCQLGGVFHNSHVIIASFTGDLNAVTEHGWYLALTHFPLLLRLMATDTSGEPSSAVEHFFDALGHSADPARPMVSPHLQAICFRGATWNDWLWVYMTLSMQSRMRAGAKVESLWVEARGNGVDLEGKLKNAKSVLEAYTDKCSLLQM